MCEAGRKILVSRVVRIPLAILPLTSGLLLEWSRPLLLHHLLGLPILREAPLLSAPQSWTSLLGNEESVLRITLVLQLRALSIVQSMTNIEACLQVVSGLRGCFYSSLKGNST